MLPKRKLSVELQLMGQHKIFDLESRQTSFAALKDKNYDAVYS